MPVIQDFRIADDFYLWEAYQGINNGRTIIQFRIVDNFYLYQVIIAGGGFNSLWINAGTFQFTDWQPNAGVSGTIIIATIPSGYIVRAVSIKINTTFSDGNNSVISFRASVDALLSTGIFSELANNGDNNIDGQTWWGIGSGGVDGYFLMNISGAYPLYMNLEINLFTINDLSEGEIEVFYKIEKLPA